MSATLAPSVTGWGYRPHLDGLRAVAVYLVVLFHAGFGSFEGGFVGVDLFFVLSGFLVTNVIMSDLSENGTLRLGRFYARRARRLIPAAAVTVVGTSLVALLVATPLDRVDLVDDAQAASLWYANWHFLAEANDYFNADAAESPFLHFWSLAIEEQFYLVFPLLIVALWRVGKGRWSVLATAVGVLTVLGLGLQIWWAARDANRAYLGTDARFYQLLAGVLLALLLWRIRLPARVGSAATVAFPVAVVGLVVIGTSWVDVSVSTRGMLAAVCSVFIVATAELGHSSFATRTLGSSPIRYLGGVSYGTYLWHWPVVILVDRVVEASPAALFVFSAFGGTALAALSNELIERPIRRGKRLDGRPGPVIVAGVATAVVSGLVLAPALLERDDRPVVVARGEGAGITPVPDIDWAGLDLEPPPVPSCESADGSDCIAVGGEGETMMLIGDSHARMYLPAFEQIARDRGMELAVVFAQACPWMKDSYAGTLDKPGTQRCLEQRERVFDTTIAGIDPDIVVAAGRANTIGRLGTLGTTRSDLAGLRPAELYQELALSTVEQWTEEGRSVVLVQPIAEFAEGTQNPVDCLSGATFVEQCAFPILTSEVEENFMKAAARRNDSVTTIDLDDVKCPGLVVCPPIIDGVVVNRDQSHLSNAFVRHIRATIEDRLTEAGALPPSS